MALTPTPTYARRIHHYGAYFLLVFTSLIGTSLFGAVAPDIISGPDRISDPVPVAEPDDEAQISPRERVRRAKQARAARRAARNQQSQTAAAQSDVSTPSTAPPADIRDTHTCAPNGIALAGMDVVSYYASSGPVTGDPQYSTRYNNLNYHFASASHRDQFLLDPGAFLPEYLGWCATHLGGGTLSCPDPANYKIVGGKLLLFTKTAKDNARDAWEAAPLPHRRRADNQRTAFLRGDA